MPRSMTTFRTATALAASMSLLTPGLTGAAFAQQSEEQIRLSCTEEVGPNPAALEECIAQRLPAAGAPTEAPADAPAEAEALTEAPTEAPTETEAPAEAEAPAETPAAAPSEAPTAEAPPPAAPEAPAPEAAAPAPAAPEASPAPDAPPTPAAPDAGAPAAAPGGPQGGAGDTGAAPTEAPPATEAPAEAASAPDAPAPAETPGPAAPPAGETPPPTTPPVGETPGPATPPEAETPGPAAPPAAEAPAPATEAPAETPPAPGAAPADQTPAAPTEAPPAAAGQPPAAQAPGAQAPGAQAPGAQTPGAAATPSPRPAAPAGQGSAPAPAGEAAPAPGAAADAAPGAPGAQAPAAQEPGAAPVPQTRASVPETPTESAIAAEVAAQPEPELSPEQQRARDQANAALQSLIGGEQSQAAAAVEGAAGEVDERTVAAGDTRTSDQEFATEAVVTERDEDDDDGFDRNDRLLLGALGALAVGTVLVNQSRVVSNSGDRVVVQREDGGLQVLKDDGILIRQPGSEVRTERFDDGSTRQVVQRADGSSVVTIRDASLRVIKREVVQPDGTRYLLIDDTETFEPVDVASLPEVSPAVSSQSGDDPLAAALAREQGLDRRFSLSQIRNIAEVRALAPAFDVSTVTFASGSAAISPDQASNLNGLAQEILRRIQANPREVFLVEGHTDATGDAALNLALSDRRAESLALALNEYFGVPVENMVVQGYGESFLIVPTQTAEVANRRATLRQITGLLQTAAAN